MLPHWACQHAGWGSSPAAGGSGHRSRLRTPASWAPSRAPWASRARQTPKPELGTQEGTAASPSGCHQLLGLLPGPQARAKPPGRGSYHPLWLQHSHACRPGAVWAQAQPPCPGSDGQTKGSDHHCQLLWLQHHVHVAALHLRRLRDGDLVPQVLDEALQQQGGGVGGWVGWVGVAGGWTGPGRSAAPAEEGKGGGGTRERGSADRQLIPRSWTKLCSSEHGSRPVGAVGSRRRRGYSRWVGAAEHT